ncbi:hypothetical protein [Streptomyces avermitilis]|uniref:hypothetical protein n=1 Tax=Streptomyces avermitilis TaxID=33903 RepID=UPI0033B9600D
MRNVRSRLRALLATAAAADPGGQSGTAKSGTKPTVALVHGGFADASNWNAVITELQKDGWGLVATTDKAIPPALERFEYRRAHARDVEVPGASHAVLISHPGTATDMIEDAARTTAK